MIFFLSQVYYTENGGLLLNTKTTRYKPPNVSGCYLKEIMVLSNARGPQHHPSRKYPSCQTVRSPTPRQHHISTGYYLSAEGSEHFFFEGWGGGGRG